MNPSAPSLLPSLPSSDGPALAPEGPGHSPTSPSPQLEEMDPRLLEFEQDPPNWRELASPDALSSLSKRETKRQEVINGEERRRRKWVEFRLSVPVLNPSTHHPSFIHLSPSFTELFATEHAHVRMLSVLQTIFSKPLEREELLTTTELATIFPSLDEIFEMHCECQTPAENPVQSLRISAFVVNYS